MRAVLMMVCLSLGAAVAQQYTDRYDNINLDEILTNRRLLVPYVNCVLDKGRCSPDGRELKVNLSDALQTGCSKCTPKQEEGAYKVILHLIEHEIEFWKQLVAKYDPDNKYRKMYEDRAAANGIKIPA